MNWKLRGLAIVGALTVAAGFVAVPAFAAAPVNGVGTVSNCKMSGSIAFSPALSNTTKVVTTTITTNITCHGGTGDGANIATGSAKGVEKKSESCSSLAGSTPHKLYISTKWVVKKGKRALNASNGTLTKVASSISNSGVITFNASGKVSSGSFSKAPNNDILAHAIIQQNASTVVAQCGAAGVSKLTIQPTSAIQIN
ncbi:MAG TPA: hypothetical protein VGO03_13700 [Acidimicrobiia bacterium]|jgi:hypothetical protein